MSTWRGVTKAYHTPAGDFFALRGIDLTVAPGEFVALLGRSGAGKSTLINVITGIDRPTAGSVQVAGEPIHKLSEAQITRWRGRQVGVIFQSFQLMPMLTCVQNVMLPMDFAGLYKSPRQQQERAMQLLEADGDRRTRATSCRRRSPAASASGSPSPGPWPTIRSSWRPTSRPAASIRARPTPCSRCLSGWSPPARRS